MAIEVFSPPEFARVEIGAYLLGHILLSQPLSVDELFARRAVIHEGTARKFMPVAEISPWTAEDLQQLLRLFPTPIAHSDFHPGVNGTSIRYKHHEQPHIRIDVDPEVASDFAARLRHFRPEVTIPMEIVTAEAPRFASSTGTSSMVLQRGGASISPQNGTASGTLGAWLREADSGNFIGISNNHVLSECGRFSNGEKVVQPGKAIGGTSSSVIGEIQEVIDLTPFDQHKPDETVNLVDVAWCRPHQPDKIDASIGSRRLVPIGEVNLIREYQHCVSLGTDAKVTMSGASSGDVVGTVTSHSKVVFVLDDAGTKYLFEDLLEFEFSDVSEGDSGAVVLSDPGQCIGGLFFAILPGYPKVGYASPWEHVCNASKRSFCF